MKTRAIAAAAGLALAVGACGAPEEASDSDGTWDGTITTEGGVTTVANESGSLWGGTARLVEEVSIGVERGDDAYMFGRIDSLWATDEEIFVLDTQVPVIRVFDHDGAFLRDIGTAGQGPGEYVGPFSIGGDREGRLWVADSNTGRISTFSLAGEFLDSWTVGRLVCCIVPMVVTADGVPYLQVRDPELSGESPAVYSMRAFGPDGAYGPLLRPPEFDVPDHTFDFPGRRPEAYWSPSVIWVLTTRGEVITGASHEYRFEIRQPDGTVTIAERNYAPVAIHPDEREWRRRATMASFRRSEPGWTWDGAEMPETKPAFSRFWPTASGEIWVIRPGPGRRLPRCDPDASIDDHSAFQAASCWRDTELVDVFDADGRFLGEIEVPDEVNLRFAFPSVRGDTVIANFYDESGTIMVKRYRLVLPGEE